MFKKVKKNHHKLIKMFFRWAKMLSGKSYYHVSQGLGRAFIPGELKGYFNDLTGKRAWTGFVNNEGIPINLLIDGSTIYFPTTIIQKALGHWDHYIITNNKDEFYEFLKICSWLVLNQDDRGGWAIDDNIFDLNPPSKYSAMPQGQAISALVRAWKITDEDKYLNSAKKAYELMITPIDKNGTAIYSAEQLYLEEYPAIEKNTILNGWIFALFGIYDYYLTTQDMLINNLFYKSFNTLKYHLDIYDSGYWSYYDEKRNISSPFYHFLHINQLEALFMITNENILKVYIEKWKNYKNNFFKKNYAFVLKVCQKIKNPPYSVIIK